MSANRQDNVKWVDGLRGIASLTVLLTHVTRAFDDDIFKSTSAEGASPRLFQYPILRVLLQGRIGVPIFSLVTGYVCALKPIRLFAAGHQERALQSIAKSAFRRIPRLVLPAWIATTSIWLICQLGGFDTAKHVESWWINVTSPTRQDFGPAVVSLLSNLINTWVRSTNEYEANQWTLLPLLKGAFLVYTFLYATSSMKPRYRMMAEIGLFIYYFLAHDPEYGIHFFFGAFLCDLSQYPAYNNWIATRKWPGRILSPILILVGLLFASYPEAKQEWMPWSNFMKSMAGYIFPPKHPDTPRFYSGIGTTLIALGIHFSDLAKVMLSHKYLLWAGKNSFAVYLLHGTLLRTVLVWLVFGLTHSPDVVKEDGSKVAAPHLKLGGRLKFWFWLPIWFVFQYWVAHLWTKFVDPFCARVTQRVEEYVFEEQGEKSILP